LKRHYIAFLAAVARPRIIPACGKLEHLQQVIVSPNRFMTSMHFISAWRFENKNV
jgi:hypothetical protein